MDVFMDYPKRLEKIRMEMQASGIDLLIATRTVSLSYVAGAFVPWRSTVLVSRDGYTSMTTLLIDLERIRHESWLSTLHGYAPLPGMDLWDVTVHQIKTLGLEKASIGVEVGHSPRGNTGYLFSTEFDLLRQALPDATFAPANHIVDRASYIKEPGEIALMRQAAAMADCAVERVKEALCVGMTEAEIAGIGEMELRRLGSSYHWAVTGSSEVASGYRACWAMNGTTPPSTKLIQKGENIIVDFHPCCSLYYSDLAHNFIIGEPSAEQARLADAFTQTAQALIGALKAGSTVGQVFRTVHDTVSELGYAGYTIPSFGHGLGIMGHEWYPAIVDNDEFRNVVLEENAVEVAFLAMAVPGVCGMRLETPVHVTTHGGEMLCATEPVLTVIGE
jgi:Xaa-Pro aminopeptidase